MKKILYLIIGLVLIIGITGCQTDNIEVDTPQELMSDSIEFERVKYEELDNDMQAKVDKAKFEKGHKILYGPSSQNVYLAIFSGEKPSAGYGIEVIKVVVNEDITEVTVNQVSPGKDIPVAEVITYPMDIIKIQGITDNIEVIYLEPTTEEGKPSPDSEIDPNTPVSSPAESTLLDTQIVVAEYVGQIDNNSIEVKIEDGPQALRLNGMAKEQLSELGLDTGDLVELEVFTNENNQLTVYSMKNPSL